MAAYVLVTKLSAASMKDPKGRRRAGQLWKRKIEEACPKLRWIAHYALLGPYDFLDIYDAPDAETAFRVSLLSRELGAVSAESWPAVDYEAFLPIIESTEEVLVRGTARAVDLRD